MKLDPKKRPANNDFNLGEPEVDEEVLPMEGPSMEDRVQVMLDRIQDWKVSKKVIRPESVFIELVQNQFTISFRWALRSSNCALYEDGVENADGVEERIRHKIQFSKDVSIEESMSANLDECMIYVLHAL